MNPNRLTERAREALVSAQDLAQARNSGQVEPEHLLYALVSQDDGVAPQILRALAIDPSATLRDVEQALEQLPKVYGGQLALSQRLSRALARADEEAKNLHDDYVSTEHLLLAIAEQTDGPAGKLLARLAVTREKVLSALTSIRGNQRVTDQNPEEKYQALEKYGRDLTELARQGKLDPVIGRDEEIRRVIQVLSRRTKNNPVLIGEPGVGKTAIVEGLALRIVARRRTRGL